MTDDEHIAVTNTVWARVIKITMERDELRASVEALLVLNQDLRAEVERLQRENGALARMYALSEEMLRQRTEQVERLRAALEGVFAEADRKTDAFDRAHAALGR